MKNVLLTMLSICTLFFCSAFMIEETSVAPKRVDWMHIEDAFEQVKEEPRNVVIDVYTNWCGWCKKMDKATFNHPKVADYINQNYYAVKLNAEMKEPVKVGGKTYKYVGQGRRGAHELAAILLENRMSFPSTVILDGELSKLTIVPGFVDAPKMDKILRYFGDGFYPKTHWKEFDKNFKSKIK